MAELTQDQVDRAVKAMDAYTPTVITNTELGHMVRAAAPFLQLPWDEPTEEESSVIHSSDLGLRLTSSFDKNKRSILSDFVLRRNAALLPKPVDPRKKVVVGLLLGRFEEDVEAFAERLISIMDSAK